MVPQLWSSQHPQASRKKRLSSDLSAEIPAGLLRSTSIILLGLLYLISQSYSVELITMSSVPSCSRLVLLLSSSPSVFLLSFDACSVSSLSLSLSCPVHSSAFSLGFLDLLKTTHLDLHCHRSEASIPYSAALLQSVLSSCLTSTVLQCKDLLHISKLFSLTSSPHLFPQTQLSLLDSDALCLKFLGTHLTFAAFSLGPQVLHSSLGLHHLFAVSPFLLVLNPSSLCGCCF